MCNMNRLISLVAAMTMLHCAVLTHPFASGAEPKKQFVDAVDIPEKVEILGKTGVPLGNIVTIRGKWIDGDKKYNLYLFHVTEIDGKKHDDHCDLRIAATREKGVNIGIDGWDWSGITCHYFCKSA
jgi:hypothetical protein